MFHYSIYICISLLISFWVYIKGFISSTLVAAYIGNKDAASGLNNIGDYYSSLNFGEIKSGDFWSNIPIFLYKHITSLGIDSQIIHSFSVFFFVFIGLLGIELLIKKYNHENIKYSVFIAIGYVFSTFSVINFIGATIFVYLYWLIPISIYAMMNWKYWGYFIYFLLIGLASAVNLPFGLMLIVLGFGLGILFNNKSLKDVKSYYFLFFGILISFIFIFPNIYFLFSNTEAAKGILGSETFYRNGTTMLTFVRGITDWGFFSGHNGYLYRDYSPFYNSIIGYFTALWLIVPITILILNNKENKRKNSLIMFSILLLSFLILGNITDISNSFTNVFYSLPLSSIFRNTSKFFFLIYVLLLIMLITNKNIKIASSVFFLAALPTLIMFLSGNIITENVSKTEIPNDYHNIYLNKLTNPYDNILVFPQQYFGIYNFGNGIKQFGSSTLLELFLEGNFIQKRCAGCGNYNFNEDRNILLDIYSLNWKEKLEEYGINKIIYDDNTDKDFYKGTLKRLDFEEKILDLGILSTVSKNGEIYIYNLIYESKKIAICNPFWINGNTGEKVQECKNGEKYFTPNSYDYIEIQKIGSYHKYTILALFLIFLSIGLFLSISKKLSNNNAQ